jgi:hypothetical protein
LIEQKVDVEYDPELGQFAVGRKNKWRQKKERREHSFLSISISLGSSKGLG